MPGASARHHRASRPVRGCSIHPPSLEFFPGINVLRADSRKAPDRPECFGIIACSGSTALFEHRSGARQSQAWARNQKSPSEWVTAGVTSDGLRCPLPSHRWPAPRRRAAGLIQDKQELPRQGRIRPKSGVRAKKGPLAQCASGLSNPPKPGLTRSRSPGLQRPDARISKPQVPGQRCADGLNHLVSGEISSVIKGSASIAARSALRISS